MSLSESEPDRLCTVERYTRAWEMGTGLQVALPPGIYRITGEECRDGVRYLRLEGTYRIDERRVSRATDRRRSA